MIDRFLLFLIIALICTPAAAEQKRFSPQPQLARMPVSFEPNVGQADTRYSFIATRQGLQARFRRSGVDFEVEAASGRRVQFPVEFGDTESRVEGEEPLSGKVNYLLGQDSSHWLRNVSTFRKVRYRKVSRGIDLVFYGNGQEIEHDFIVAPGADPSSIRIKFQPGAKAEVSPDDSIYVRREDAVLKFTKPVAHQETARGRKIVEAKFTLKKNSVGFAVGEYDRSLPLVIDPALVYSTFTADAYAPVVGVATDAGSNTYLVGYTFQSGLPVVGAFQPACSSCRDYPDIFITKLNGDGTQVLYSTYLGGSGYDMPVGIQVDPSGNAILAGISESSDFPLKNGSNGSPSRGMQVGFVTSLSPDGSSLNYSTMLGNAQQGQTYLRAMAVGPDGSAYLAGATDDATFPVTPGALRNAVPGAQNLSAVFVCKILPAGNPAYSALVGVPGENASGGAIGLAGLAIDSQGAAYLYGKAGTHWPTTEGAYQTSIPGTDTSAALFITKITPDASAFAYSTFLAPTTGAYPSFITVSASGEAWVTGTGADSTFPTTPDAYSGQMPPGVYGASYLSRLSADGRQLAYSTYVLSSSYGYGTYPTSIAIDSAGHIWMAGSTSDSKFPLTHPIQSSKQYGATTGFVAEFDRDASSLLFSTYLGARSGTQITGMAIDPANLVHLAGWSYQDLYTTPGAYLGSVAPLPANVYYEYPFTALLDPGDDSAAICSISGVGFPTTALGSTSTTTVTLKNCGTISTALSFTMTDAQFSLPAERNGCTATLAAEASCTFAVNFTPSAEGSASAMLTVTPAARGIPQQITVGGRGVTPRATLPWGSALRYSPLLVGKSSTQQIAIANSGEIPLQINVAGIVVTGDYTLSTATCPPTLNPGNTCRIAVTFAPTAAGQRDGTMRVQTDDPAHSTLMFTMAGLAFATYPAPVLDALGFNTAPIGATEITATALGSGFFPESIVKVNGSERATTYNSDTRLSFKVDSSLLREMKELDVTVVSPEPGGGSSNAKKLTVYKSLPGRFRHMVYSRSTGLLYVTVPTGVASDADTVLIMDPYTGDIRDRIPVGRDPNALALSFDEQYLYVGLDGDHVVKRINCTSKLIERTYSLPADSRYTVNPDTAYQILGVPGSPKSFVVVLQAQRSPSSDGLALYNDAGMVKHLPLGYPDWLEVYSAAFTKDPATIYAMPFDQWGNGYFTLVKVDAAGLYYTRPTGSFVGAPSAGSSVTSDGTLLYTNDGSVFDPAAAIKSGRFEFPNWSYVLPDAVNGRVLAGASDTSPSDYQAVSVGSYAMANYSLLNKLYFDPTFTGFAPRDIVRWGRDGLAFISGSDDNMNPAPATTINLVRSSFGEGAPNEVPLTVASLLPASVAACSPDVRVSASGTGFRYDTVVSVNGTQLTPELVSSSQLTFVVPSSLLRNPGTASVTLSNPRTGGGTAAASFVVFGVPALSVNPNSLNFGPTPVDTSSTAARITVTNTGTADAQRLAITATGDFSQTNDCASPLAVNASCTISVLFTPRTAGDRSGALTISADESESTQSVTLTGSGAEFGIGAIDGGAPSASVPAGQSATYRLSLTSSGAFAGTIDFACTGAPQYATCTVSPVTVELGSGGTATVTVTVSTSETTSSATWRHTGVVLGAAILSPGLLLAARRGRHGARRLLCVLVFTGTVMATVVGLSSCGGGSSTSATGGGSGTGTAPGSPVTHTVAPGTYTLNVLAKAGSMQKSIPLKLTVQ